MINAKNFGGGYSVSSHSEKGGKALRLVSFSRPNLKRGGLRWNKEVTPYG